MAERPRTARPPQAEARSAGGAAKHGDGGVGIAGRGMLWSAVATVEVLWEVAGRSSTFGAFELLRMGAQARWEQASRAAGPWTARLRASKPSSCHALISGAAFFFILKGKGASEINSKSRFAVCIMHENA